MKMSCVFNEHVYLMNMSCVFNEHFMCMKKLAVCIMTLKLSCLFITRFMSLHAAYCVCERQNI